MKNTLLTIIFLSIMIGLVNSKPFRVDQVPNGNKFSCGTCHINLNTGGDRNPFGKEIEKKFLNNGNVTWGSELAKLDSDGDGVTNGEELGDKEGKWKIGDPNPGSLPGVSNPGDPNSKPVILTLSESLVSGGCSVNIYPNPAASGININITTNGENITAEIYNYNGDLMKNIINGKNLSGEFNFNWDGLDNKGNLVPSGIYFIKIIGKQINETRRIVILH